MSDQCKTDHKAEIKKILDTYQKGDDLILFHSPKGLYDNLMGKTQAEADEFSRSEQAQRAAGITASTCIGTEEMLLAVSSLIIGRGVPLPVFLMYYQRQLDQERRLTRQDGLEKEADGAVEGLINDILKKP